MIAIATFIDSHCFLGVPNFQYVPAESSLIFGSKAVKWYR